MPGFFPLEDEVSCGSCSDSIENCEECTPGSRGKCSTCAEEYELTEVEGERDKCKGGESLVFTIVSVAVLVGVAICSFIILFAISSKKEEKKETQNKKTPAVNASQIEANKSKVNEKGLKESTPNRKASIEQTPSSNQLNGKENHITNAQKKQNIEGVLAPGEVNSADNSKLSINNLKYNYIEEKEEDKGRDKKEVILDFPGTEDLEQKVENKEEVPEISSPINSYMERPSNSKLNNQVEEVKEGKDTGEMNHIKEIKENQLTNQIIKSNKEEECGDSNFEDIVRKEANKTHSSEAKEKNDQEQTLGSMRKQKENSNELDNEGSLIKGESPKLMMVSHIEQCCICDSIGTSRKISCNGFLCVDCSEAAEIGFSQGKYSSCNQCAQYILSFTEENKIEEQPNPMSAVCGACFGLKPDKIVPCENFPSHLLHAECLRDALYKMKC
eukprot:CAMPEP_0170528804 /NCGR_PEP_ID=MMETSP0209-20121228/14255_1 /TAXON_ID=665100 ORGANISM="Litonotus pictus, Strain P1" /NCGR_SAMPLE_ID=MMETSP0209 /ASSEMBLY_ACC=CAM_ASM_000301 /LENGTH=442 /DNA_ID=CAMNT_0010820205 /DNA_START=452 /DNA_END=1777 /DNA_ORIENTATION=+